VEQPFDRRDEAAVQAAVTQRWSNGPVEGHVNRLKTIKRQRVPVTDAGRCTQGICRANRGNRAARTAIWAPSKLVPFTSKQILRIPSGSQRQGRNR
jgi:hypothetical protein